MNDEFDKWQARFTLIGGRFNFAGKVNGRPYYRFCPTNEQNNKLSGAEMPYAKLLYFWLCYSSHQKMWKFTHNNPTDVPTGFNTIYANIPYCWEMECASQGIWT